ncbi:hypothetical protein VNI00_001744 [Paramarasmius palmivorus]|uniref:LIM zinc-binding domain-containing protein n=1 Tax=Paramarasmius palmivorus TaxID=297713 RepID=A0AAW0E5M7_9AGAR
MAPPARSMVAPPPPMVAPVAPPPMVSRVASHPLPVTRTQVAPLPPPAQVAPIAPPRKPNPILDGPSNTSPTKGNFVPLWKRNTVSPRVVAAANSTPPPIPSPSRGRPLPTPGAPKSQSAFTAPPPPPPVESSEESSDDEGFLRYANAKRSQSQIQPQSQTMERVYSAPAVPSSGPRPPPSMSNTRSAPGVKSNTLRFAAMSLDNDAKGEWPVDLPRLPRAPGSNIDLDEPPPRPAEEYLRRSPSPAFGTRGRQESPTRTSQDYSRPPQQYAHPQPQYSQPQPQSQPPSRPQSQHYPRSQPEYSQPPSSPQSQHYTRAQAEPPARPQSEHYARAREESPTRPQSQHYTHTREESPTRPQAAVSALRTFSSRASIETPVSALFTVPGGTAVKAAITALFALSARATIETSVAALFTSSGRVLPTTAVHTISTTVETAISALFASSAQYSQPQPQPQQSPSRPQSQHYSHAQPPSQHYTQPRTPSPKSTAPAININIESPAPLGGRDRVGHGDLERMERESEGSTSPGIPEIRLPDEVPKINLPDEVPRIILPDEVQVQVPKINLPDDDEPRQVPMINLPDDDDDDGIPSINVTPAEPKPKPAPQPQPIVYEVPGMGVSQGIPSQPSTSYPKPPHQHPQRHPSSLTCSTCHLPIIGRLVSAMSLKFHPSCFRCTSCHTLLEHISSYESPTTHLPYCGLCYHEEHAPKCWHCQTPIYEERFISLDDGELGRRCYHEQHFFCAECGDPFLSPSSASRLNRGVWERGRGGAGAGNGEMAFEGDGTFRYTEDDEVGFTVYKGYPYCEPCHVRLRLPKCKRCKKPLRQDTDAVEALGGKWCWGCFRCAGCDEPFEEPAFYERDKKAWCERCFSVILRNEV